MYATKEYNSKNSKNFIGVGDPYIKKQVKNSRFAGSQFQTNPAKRGQNAGTFNKHPEYMSDPYNDKYKNAQKKFKEAGFGSNDADRKGEFTLDVVCKQWKEKLKRETLKLGDDVGDDEELDPEMAKATFTKSYPKKDWFQTRVPFHSYDIGRADEGITPICNKCQRETFYCPHRVKAETSPKVRELRRTDNGMSPTSYGTYGSWSADPNADHVLQKPIAGRVRTTNAFYDCSHLSPGM